MDPITSAGPIKKTALLLFYGWGYNFYRTENQLRADDLLIRSKVGGILADAASHLKSLENAYRRAHLPPPTRENPFPDPAKIAQARRIERCAGLIEEVTTAIASAPAPTNDKIWLRHRTEAGILEILQSIDVALTDAAIAVHDLVIEWGEAEAANPAIDQLIAESLKPLKIILKERAERLTLMI